MDTTQEEWETVTLPRVIGIFHTAAQRTWAERHAELMQRVATSEPRKQAATRPTLEGAAGIVKSRANLRKGR